MKRIKVLEVVPSLQNGGVEQFLYNYLANMDLSGFEIWILTQEPRFLESEKRFVDLGIKIKAVPPKKKNLFKYYRLTRKIMKKEQFDIIHCHLSAKSFWMLIIAKMSGIKIRIYHAHEARVLSGIKKAIYRIYAKLSLRFATNLVACGRESANFCFGKEKRYVLLRNLIDCDKFQYSIKDRDVIRKALGVDEGAFLIGHVGRFELGKNQRFVVDLFKSVVDSKPETKLLLVGNGVERKNIREYVDSMGMRRQVYFVKSTHEINKYYSAMDYFVLPSKYEGFPVSVVEAQCAGLPVLLSESIDRNVKVNKNVKFLSINDSKEWAEMILRDSLGDDRAKLGERFKESEFDVKKNAVKLAELYTKLFSKEPV